MMLTLPHEACSEPSVDPIALLSPPVLMAPVCCSVSRVSPPVLFCFCCCCCPGPDPFAFGEEVEEDGASRVGERGDFIDLFSCTRCCPPLGVAPAASTTAAPAEAGAPLLVLEELAAPSTSTSSSSSCCCLGVRATFGRGRSGVERLSQYS